MYIIKYIPLIHITKDKWHPWHKMCVVGFETDIDKNHKSIPPKFEETNEIIRKDFYETLRKEWDADPSDHIEHFADDIAYSIQEMRWE